MPFVPYKKSVGGFIGNVGKSALSNVGAIGSAILHPIDTVGNVAKTSIGALQLLLPGEQGYEPYARNVGNFYKQRYGGLSKIGNTLYNDPVGAALDASVVLGGAGAVTKGVGEAAKIGELVKIGEGLSTASRMVDPLTLPGRAVSKVISMSKIGKGIEGMSKEFSVHATRANPSQITKIESITGMPFEDFLAKYNLQGGAKANLPQLEKIIQPLQEQYNLMVRSGKPIDITNYINLINDKIRQIRSSDFSTEAEAVAQKLEKERDFFIAKTGGNKIPVDVLTETKGSQYGKVPEGVMTDPTSVNANKIIGGVGRQALDQIAPGSANVGKELQALREYQNIAKKQSNLGLGSQVMGVMHKGYGGALPGYLVASALGAPGWAGMFGGMMTGMALNNPRVIEAVSKGGQTLGKAMQTGVKLPFSSVANTAYDVGKIGRMFNSGLGNSSQKTTISLPQSLPQPQSNVASPNSTPFVTPKPYVPAMTKQIKFNLPKNPFKNQSNFGKSFKLKPIN